MIFSEFDKVFCISLRRREDRWKQCLDEMAKHQIPPESVERFDGVDHPTNGMAGCAHSHWRVMKQVAESNWSRVCIFEDDFQFITKDILREAGFKPESPVWKTHCSILNGNGLFRERLGALDAWTPEDWDVLYLGAGYGEPPIKRVNKHLIQCGFMQTTSSYAITREFAREFVSRIPPDDPGPIDNVIGSMAHDHVFYVLQPRLVFQRESPSDITGECHSYLFSMTDPTYELSTK